MTSREGGIGFILGSVAGVGAAVVWTSRSPAWKTLLERVRTTTDSVDRRIREVDQFVGEITGMAREQASAFKDVAEKTTRRYDEVNEVVQKNLVQSILELASFFEDVKHAVDRLVARRAADAILGIASFAPDANRS